MLDKNKNYVLLFMIIIVLYLLFLIIKPFLSAIFASIILTYALYPLYNKLNKKIKNNTLSSIILTLIILLLVILPFALAANIVAKESVTAYNYIKSRDFSLFISKYFHEDSSELVKTVVDRASFFLVKFTSEFILSLPSILLSFFVMIFLTYYLFKDGNKFLEIFRKIIPLKTSMKDKLYEKFKITTKALIYGVLLTAVVQGLVAGIGYFIFKISSPLLFGFITMIGSLMPFLGTIVVWLPLGVFQLLQGNLFSGIGLLLYGALIISSMDNLIKPKFIGERAKIHPVIILIGLLGGIKVFGFMGIFIGPLFLTLVVEALKIRGEISEISGS